MINNKISKSLNENFKGNSVKDSPTENTLVGAIESENIVSIKGVNYRKIKLRIVDNISMKMDDQLEILMEKTGRQQHHIEVLNEHIELKKKKIINLQTFVKDIEQKRHLEQENWKREKEGLINDLNKEQELRQKENNHWQILCDEVLQQNNHDTEEPGKKLALLKLEYHSKIKSQENTINILRENLIVFKKKNSKKKHNIQEEPCNNEIVKGGINKKINSLKEKFAIAIKAKNHQLIDLQNKIKNQRKLINEMMGRHSSKKEQVQAINNLDFSI